jgi:hypothetical protein
MLSLLVMRLAVGRTPLGGWCETALLKKVRGVELGSRHRIDVSGVDLCWALDGSRGTD